MADMAMAVATLIAALLAMFAARMCKTNTKIFNCGF